MDGTDTSVAGHRGFQKVSQKMAVTTVHEETKADKHVDHGVV